MMTTALMMALCAGMVLAQAQDKAAAAPKPTAEVLKQIENDWVDAQKARNADKLGAILADDWVGLGWSGKTSNKAQALADLKSTDNSLDSIEMGPMKVRVFGTIAIVTGSDTEKSTENGKDSSGKYIWTDVFAKRAGQWKAIASQSTKVPE
ncbi:MAG: nuclear transport factor 2 family protein [Bryobacteraceae bacterium]|jgi:ketosteroid isomerase-like protein